MIPPWVLAFWTLSICRHVEPERADTAEVTSICLEIAESAQDAPLWPGDAGTYRTAALLVSIAWHESHLTRQAQNNQSCGPWQTPCLEPRTAATALVHIARSLHDCGDLTQYASGRCGGAPLTAGYREQLGIRLSLMAPVEAPRAALPRRAPCLAP